MTEQDRQADVNSDEPMTKALRTCGFHVRTLNLAPGQRPQVVGNIDHAAALFKLAVAGTDAAIAQHAANVPAVDENDVILDRRDLFDFLRSAWRDGQDHGGEMDEVDRWSRGSDYAKNAIKGWTTLRATPVPAAGLQPVNGHAT